MSETTKETMTVTTTTIAMSLGSTADFGGGGGATSDASSSESMRLAIIDVGSLNAISVAALYAAAGLTAADRRRPRYTSFFVFIAVACMLREHRDAHAACRHCW